MRTESEGDGWNGVSHKVKPVLAAISLSVLLASCMVGPKYTKPQVAAAPGYGEQPPQSYAETPGWKTANPSDSALRGNWWELFGNPDLNALEEQIAPANQTLKVAEANFLQARAQIQYNRSNLYPTVTVGAQISHSRISGYNPSGVGLAGDEYGAFALPISVSWEPDWWGQIRRSITSARELAQASAADLANVRLELQTELAVDYFEARSLDAEKKLLDDTVMAYQKALQLTQNRYAGG